MFSSEVNGYNKKEVDKKLNALLVEITNLKHLASEKDKLNLGLATALQKSKQIESSARNIYELKTQKILILYKTLEKSFKSLFKLYPQIAEFDDIKDAFDNFSKTVQTSLMSSEPKKSINATVNTENDTIRLLLNKMSTYSNSAPSKEKKTVIKRKDTAVPIPIEHASMIKPIADLEINSSEKFESLADKFLACAETEHNAYTKILNNKRPNDLYPEPNESGFDLKEAVNPKDDLLEIMKSFNLND